MKENYMHGYINRVDPAGKKNREMLRFICSV